MGNDLIESNISRSAKWHGPGRCGKADSPHSWRPVARQYQGSVGTLLRFGTELQGPRPGLCVQQGRGWGLSGWNVHSGLGTGKAPPLVLLGGPGSGMLWSPGPAKANRNRNRHSGSRTCWTQNKVWGQNRVGLGEEDHACLKHHHGWGRVPCHNQLLGVRCPASGMRLRTWPGFRFLGIRKHREAVVSQRQVWVLATVTGQNPLDQFFGDRWHLETWISFPRRWECHVKGRES